MSTAGCVHDHAVRFYQDHAFLCDAVAAFVAEGLDAAEPIIIIATAEHCDGIRAQLATRGHDFDRVQSRGQLMCVDATESLALFMRGGMPDDKLFEDTIGRLVGDRMQAHRRRSVRAYGEMVDVLWREGNAAAALRLEEMWNELAQRYTFSLLCAYGIANFYKVTDTEYFDRICAAHSRVHPTEQLPAVAEQADYEREITRLQQRAVVLEAELAQRRVMEQELRDALTHVSRSDDALQAARAYAAHAERVKADFLAVMSHELRTPLNAILGYETLLEQEVGGPTTDEQKLYIARIRNGAEQLMQLIDQILSVSRLEGGDAELSLESANINQVVSDAVARMAPAAATRGLVIQTTLPQHEIACYTDVGKLRQILLNLLSNAVKFTTAGLISLKCDATPDGLVFEVRDTGTGIDACDFDRIFDRFVQLDPSASRRYGGVGVGLALSRDYARLLGGDLTVASERGVGSIFRLCLPTRAFPYLHNATV